MEADAAFVDQDGGVAAAPLPLLREEVLPALGEVQVTQATADDLAPRVVEATQAAANSGAIGDGKIFVLDVGQAVRIRTGETGETAL